MTEALSILGTGVHLPPSRSVKELVETAGAVYTDYNDWENVCVAREEDHPSTMGAAALQQALAAANATEAEPEADAIPSEDAMKAAMGGGEAAAE